MSTSRRTVLRSAVGVGTASTAAVLASGGDASAATTSSEEGVDWLNVTYAPFNATGNGTSDDTTAIQDALNAAPLGGVVYLPAGRYATSAPITIPPQVTLRGSHSSHTDSTTCAIAPLASFSGAAVILIVDKSTGGYSVVSNQQGIFDVTIDGSALPSGSSVDGIQAQGYVHGVIIQDVQVANATGHGITNVTNSSGFAYSWRGTRIVVNTSGSYGFSLGGMTDCTWIDCESIAAGKAGFNFGGQPSNTQLIGCRSEYSNYDGFAFSGAWTGGNANGGCLMVSCTTDGNNRNGISVTATGDSPLTIIGYYGRRDGANGKSGGAGYAGLSCSASTIPVIVDGITVIPGIANSGGVNSPEYGVSIADSSSTVSISNGLVHGYVLGWYDDGTNTHILRGANIIERYDGSQSSYSTAYNGLQTTATGLDMVGRSLGVPTPRDHGLVAWSFDPATVGGNSEDVVNSGEIYMAALYVSRTAAVSTIYWGVYTAATAPTSGENHILLIDAAGTVVASASIDTSVASAGAYATTISATTVSPGMYWVGILQNATTPAKLYRASNGNGTLVNLGISDPALKRFVTNGTGLTSVPTAITPSSNATSQYALLAGIA
jgi:hypothetical protein